MNKSGQGHCSNHPLNDMPASFAGFSMGVSHLPSHIISITGSESHQGVPSNRIPRKSLHVGQCLRMLSFHLAV